MKKQSFDDKNGIFVATLEKDSILKTPLLEKTSTNFLVCAKHTASAVTYYLIVSNFFFLLEDL